MTSLAMLLQGFQARFKKLHRDEAGASVLEWALIAAVVVVAAAIIGGVITQVVKDKSDKIKECSNVGATC